MNWPWKKQPKPTPEEEQGPLISHDALQLHTELVRKFREILSEKAYKIATNKTKTAKIVVMPEDVQTAYKQIVRPGF